MQALKIIRRDAEELRATLKDTYSLKTALADFLKKYEDELQDYDYNNLGVIEKKLKELAPHLG